MLSVDAITLTYIRRCAHPSLFFVHFAESLLVVAQVRDSVCASSWQPSRRERSLAEPERSL